MNLTPLQIVAELDKYIIGQKNAKKNVAIALRNRWRRMNAPEELRKEINPNNILMIGSTGVGKTEVARRLAKIAQAPFTKVEASKFTEVGYVGRDVESMVRDLMEQSINMVQAEKKLEVELLTKQIVEDIILDALIPPINAKELEQTDNALNEQTREKFRQKIRSGELDQRKIEINVSVKANGGIGVAGPGIDEAAMMNIQEMISGMMPKKQKKRKLTIAEAKKLLSEEESAKLIDMDDVKDEAIFRAENTGIIFIDEIDKIAAGANKSGGADVSRQGVQRDLLPIVEGSAVTTKYGIVHTDHILFIAAGAFHLSKPSDLIPELQGRFPIRVELENLTQQDFYQILKEPKNALTKQYIALLASEGVTIDFNDDALVSISEIAFELNQEMENIGARRLHTVMSHLLNDILFDVPDLIKQDSEITVDKKLVEERLSNLIKNRDLSEYIL
jgi:ATP-dependent HslUV protease ATP-binding subunit HslU